MEERYRTRLAAKESLVSIYSSTVAIDGRTSTAMELEGGQSRAKGNS